MRKVIGIGETVLDMIFRNNKPEAAVPGGSTFNSMVSIGRTGTPAYFISEIGNNRPGKMIKDFMTANGVDYEYVNELPMKQPLSMAFLDENNDAEYSFYRDELDVHPDFRYPPIEEDDVLLYGSFFALNPDIRPQMKAFLEYAHEHGAILYYDLNFRPSHAKDLGEVSGSIVENIRLSDVIRGSREDFMTLYGMENPDQIYAEKIGPLCPHFIFTNSSDPVEVRDADAIGKAPSFKKAYPVAPVDTVSTIGAGDNFNAGFVFGLIKAGITKRQIADGLDEAQWDRLIAMAQSFSANCCRSMFNYITPDFAQSLNDSK